MAVFNYDTLAVHVGHDIHCVKYHDVNVAIECWDCNEILLDFDREYDDLEEELNDSRE